MTSSTIFGQATNWTLVTDKNPYTLGMQFSVSQSVSLTGIWFHSASGAAVLPVQCVIFNGDTTAQVASTLNTTPSWSGAAGSGWVKCAYDGSVTLAPGINYVAAVLYNTTGSNWYSGQNGYWTSGAGAAGITNGPLSAPKSSSALNGQAVFHAGATLTFPATTQTGFDFGVDVEVTTASGAGPDVSAAPPLIRPHPYGLIRDEAQQRIDWAGAGVADLTVAFSSTSGGVDTYNVTSPYNGTGSHQMRVLAPTAPNPDYPHAFLLMLPVQQNQDTNLYGDSIGTAQAIAAHNGWNLTCVQPGYAGLPSGAEGPWFADNPLNRAIWQETFTLLVTAWIRKNLAVTGTEQVYLIGFSRSGLGAQNLLFRHPYTYAAAASWDSPFGMTDYDGTDPIRGSTVGGDPQDGFGTSANFTNKYQLTAGRLAGLQATGQYGSGRIWIGLGPDIQPDFPWYDGLLTTAGIPHTRTFSNTVEAHAWQTDWVAAGLQAIIPSNAPTVLPQQYASHPVFTRLLEAAGYRLTTGMQPAAAAAVNAALASGAAAALNASASTSASGTANAVVAAGTGAAQGPVPAIAVTAVLATGAGAALNATASASFSGTGSAVLASAAGTAQQPAAAIGVSAAAATGAGAAQGARRAATGATLTASDAPASVLTATDQRTGGPG